VTAGAVAWTNSRLPFFKVGVIDTTPDPDVFIPAEFDRDAPGDDDPYTGNSLLLARQLEPIEFAYDHDQTEPTPGTCTPNPATPDVVFQGDQYRFEYYYLAENNSRNFAGMGNYLDVIEAHSQSFADYFQLSTMDNCQRPQVVDGLIAAGITQAWDPGKDAATAFYNLVGGGGLDPAGVPVLSLVKQKTMMPELRGGRISGRMEYSVGYNANAITNYTFPDPIPYFALANNNFPGGLEFKGVDNAGVKKILSRIVILSQYGGNMESQANYVITSYNGL
jgi:hypothetical protein